LTSDGDDGVTRLLGQLQEVIAKRADSLSRFLRPSVQHVAETAVEPCLARCVVMLGVDRFVVDMGKVSTEARDLLHQAALSAGHQFSIALIPQLVSMRDRSRNTAAVGLDGVRRDEFRIEGR
jgi:hypothetical protein